MRSSATIKQTLAVNYDVNELILADRLYQSELSTQISRAAYYKSLERLCKDGDLVRIAKNTYHLPKASKYGIVPLPEEKIVSAFTKNETGTVVGYALYNALHLTTQLSKRIDVLSSSLDGVTKKIGNVVVQRVRLVFSEDVTRMVHGLEVLQNYEKIQDMRHAAFISFSKDFALHFKESVFDEVRSAVKIKKSTISFLAEILRYYGVENNVRRHLSPLSSYKHPKMEDIYEVARIPGGI